MKKGLRTLTMLISAVLLARGIVFAEETDGLTDKSLESISANNHIFMDSPSTTNVSPDSVSGGNSGVNPSTDTPEHDPDTNPPADTPEHDPDANPPNDIPEHDSDANAPADMPEHDPGVNPPAELSPNNSPQGEASASTVTVSAPESLDFIMDPYELAGRGSIWSREFSFLNTGTVPVRISLSKLHCTVTDDVFIAESEESITEDGKTAALWLCLGNGNRIQITEDDTAYDFTLKPGESLIFWIGGRMSINSQWKDGDISLSLRYKLEAAGGEE